MTQLAGKQGAILGIANKHSIAWGIARSMHAAGARLAFNYLNERMEPKVTELTETIPGALTLPCDATKDAEIDAFFARVGEAFGGKIDFLIHSIAFANREDLEGRFVDTSRAGFGTLVIAPATGPGVSEMAVEASQSRIHVSAMCVSPLCPPKVNIRSPTGS